jgi:hypothetical protein
MAETNESSDILTIAESTTRQLNDNTKSRAKLVLERFSFTQGGDAGDSNSTIRVCKLPARARYLSMFSWARFSAFGASRVLSLGWEAYKNPKTGATIAADLTGLGTGLDVSSAGTALMSSLTTPVDDKEFINEAVLAFQCTGSAVGIPAGATVSGVIAYCLP